MSANLSVISQPATVVPLGRDLVLMDSLVHRDQAKSHSQRRYQAIPPTRERNQPFPLYLATLPTRSPPLLLMQSNLKLPAMKSTLNQKCQLSPSLLLHTLLLNPQLHILKNTLSQQSRLSRSPLQHILK